MPDTTNTQDRALASCEAVRELFLHIAKLITAKTIYRDNNPTLTNFSRSFHEAFQFVLDVEKELKLRVEQYRLLWKDEVVYESTDRNGSIAFMLFKDGVGEITFHSSVTRVELEQFVDIVKEEIHHPRPDSDIVTELWEADFAGISYRVLDEDPTGDAGDGRGGGARTNASVLQANDIPTLPGDSTRMRYVENDEMVCIAQHLLGVLEASRPQASESEKEDFIQDVLEKLFSLNGQEAAVFAEERAEEARRDKLVSMLDAALGLAGASANELQVESAERIMERVLEFAIEEANARTLKGLLSLVRSRGDAAPERIAALLSRFGQLLVDPAMLRSLADPDRTAEELLGVLHYYKEVGATTVPVICELLHAVKQPVVHREACDVLIALRNGDLRSLVDSLDIDNQLVARDVVYLLRASTTDRYPPVLKELVHYPDLRVREDVLEMLAGAGHEGAMRMVTGMLDDEARSVRVRALQVLRNRMAKSAAGKLLELCFGDNAPERDMDERKQLFATAGKLAGTGVVDPLRRTLKKKSWKVFGKHASADEKLLAVFALEQSCCEQSRELLLELATDADEKVKARAEEALKTINNDLQGELT